MSFLHGGKTSVGSELSRVWLLLWPGDNYIVLGVFYSVSELDAGFAGNHLPVN